VDELMSAARLLSAADEAFARLRQTTQSENVKLAYEIAQRLVEDAVRRADDRRAVSLHGSRVGEGHFAEAGDDGDPVVGTLALTADVTLRCASA
jgi:hypothetical protein